MDTRNRLRFPGRHWFALSVMGIAAAALLWRAVELQLIDRGFLQGEGDARYSRVVRSFAHRGMILDRNGEPLAVSTPLDSVWICPRKFMHARSQWPALARRIGKPLAEIEKLVATRRDREFVYLKRHVKPAVAAQVAALELPGVHLQREYRRYYPSGEVAAHVVGFTNVDDRGQEGVELAYDEWLRGTDGSKRVIRDRLGRTVEVVERLRSPRPGRNLDLTLDRRIQYLAHRALKSAVQHHRARSASMVILDVRSGDVLAMVNQPAYNPNNGAQRVSARYRNRAVTDTFEPGSTIKPFVVAAALGTGQVRPTTRLDTRPGFYRVGRHTVRDLHNYGVIDVKTVIKKSSNVGATKLSLAMPRSALWETFSELGFGDITGSGFPGEVGGALSHHSEWGDIHRATLAFGYGLSVTPLQLAQAYAVIASGGWLRPLAITRLDPGGPARRVLPERVAVEVRAMLESVVEEGGTGRRARISGYRVGGKTGTVRKSIVGGYAQDQYIAIFAGMVPASSPRLVGVVIVDEPRAGAYYGGEVAAPVFAEVMAGALRLLGITPDDHTVLARRIDVGRDRLAIVSAHQSLGTLEYASDSAWASLKTDHYPGMVP